MGETTYMHGYRPFKTKKTKDDLNKQVLIIFIFV